MQRKKYLYIVLTLLVIVGLGAFFIFHNHQTKQARSVIPNTSKSTTATNTTKSTGSTTGSAVSDKSQTAGTDQPTTSTTVSLMTPSGNFVSNHKPGQNGSPTTETSACTTSPGASCVIQFTQGSTVKKLDAKIADENGSVIWYWDVKDAGFSKGTWKVTAVATLGTQTQTADDQVALEVSP